MSTPTRVLTFCRIAACAMVPFLLLVPAPVRAAAVDRLPGAGWPYLLAWIGLLLAAVLLIYGQQTRRIRRKTAELRRELFERQTAEKELLASDRRLRRSLAEKESLLKEIHHRVKNNLQIVSSLLYLQEENMQDARGVAILRDCQQRVKSMALIHEQLYGTSDLAKIDFGCYIDALGASLFDAYGVDRGRIRLLVHSEAITLGVDTAVPCGLIVNELVSNALKHAFPENRRGVVDIALRTLSAVCMQLQVTDDGIGFSRKSDEAARQSLGLRLVETLVRQLDGSLSIETNPGTRFTLELKTSQPIKKDA